MDLEDNTIMPTSNGPNHRINEVSVKCPEYFKDSVAADLIDCYAPNEDQKVIIIGSSDEQARWLNASEFLTWRHALAHSLMDMRDRIRVRKSFQESSSLKCLITDDLSWVQPQRLSASLLIFSSPPRSARVYDDTASLIQGLQCVAISYSTKQIGAFCAFQYDLGRKFYMLIPPDVDSQSEEEQKEKASIESPIEEYKVIIRNIEEFYTEKDLKRFLERNGVETINVQVIQINKSIALMNKIKTGFVVCKDRESFEKALKLNGMSLYKNSLQISQYQYRK